MTQTMTSPSKPGLPSSTQPRWRGTLSLAVALTLVASAAWWMEYSYKPSKDEEESQSKKIFRLKGAGVSELRVASGSLRFAFQCLDREKNLCKPGDGSKWQLTEPSAMRADDSNVNSFLSALANAQSSESIDLSEDTDAKRAQLLKDYGLGNEERTRDEVRRIELVLLSGEKRTIWVGGSHPIGEQLFTLSSAEGEKKVFLLPSYFKTNFERDLQYWRNKKVFEIASADVTGLQLDGTRSKLKGERKDGAWSLMPSGGRADENFAGDPESIEGILSAAGNLTARAFAAEDKDSSEGREALKGTQVLSSFSVMLKDAKEPITLMLHERAAAPTAKKSAKGAAGTDDGKKVKLYATVSNLKPVFEVDNAVRNRLDKTLTELRLKRPLGAVERLAATHVAFEGTELGTAPLEFTYADSKWKAASEPNAGDGPSFDSEKIAKLLEKLSGRQIEDFVVGKDIPAGEGKGVRIFIGDEKEPRKQGFVFWKSADNHLYGRDLLSKRSEAWKLQSAMKASLPWARDFLLLKAPAAAPAGGAAPAGKSG